MTDETLTWSVRLLDDKPQQVAAIFGGAVVAFLLGVFVFRQPILGILGTGMILGATADHWLGSKFALDAKGATARTGPSVTAMEWGDVKRVLERGREIRLSPLERASKLDEFRGVGLTTTPENRLSVLEFVRAHVTETVVAEDPAGTEEAA